MGLGFRRVRVLSRSAYDSSTEGKQAKHKTYNARTLQAEAVGAARRGTRFPAKVYIQVTHGSGAPNRTAGVSGTKATSFWLIKGKGQSKSAAPNFLLLRVTGDSCAVPMV